MASQVEARATPLTRAEGVRGMIWALARKLEVLPADNAILLAVAQWALETGNGKSMMNYNAAGIKARAGGANDWTFYPTRERLVTSQALAWLRDRRVTEVSREITPNGVSYTTVRVVPDHAACCFAAYPDAESGFVDYVDLLERRFGQAWHVLLAPGTTPQTFATLLHGEGYFTASPSVYGGALALLTKAYAPVIDAYHRDVAAPPDPPPALLEPLMLARARALLATTVLYGAERSTVAWGDAA